MPSSHVSRKTEREKEDKTSVGAGQKRHNLIGTIEVSTTEKVLLKVLRAEAKLLLGASPGWWIGERPHRFCRWAPDRIREGEPPSIESTLGNQGGRATGKGELGDQDSRVTGREYEYEFGDAAFFIRELINPTSKFRVEGQRKGLKVALATQLEHIASAPAIPVDNAGFQRKGITSQLFLRKKLLTMKLSSNDTMEKHFLKFEETIKELKSVGAKLEEMDVVCHLLLTLPKSFDPLVTTLETMEPSKLTLDFVKGKLLDYELKRKNQCSEIEVPSSSAFNSRKFNKQQSVWNKKVFPFTCHNCGKKGHKRTDCHLLKQANQTSSEHVAFVSYSGNAQDETVCGKMKWYVDSGATDHMVNSKEHLTNVPMFGTKIATLKCDNGREYLPNDLVSFCKGKGIVIKTTIPYTPEQNGKAERLNRTLLEKATAMILESELSKDLWGKAVLCAAYVTNRCPTSCLENVTPSEMFYGRKPNLNNLRVFGSVAYSHIPKQKMKSKFDRKCDACIMIGYTHNGYRLWIPETRRVICARNVIFDENKTITSVNSKNERHVSETDKRIMTYTELLNESERNVEENKAIAEDEENKINEDEESDEDKERDETQTEGLRKSNRKKRRPAHFSDYELEHFALSVKSFIDEVPESYKEARSRTDYHDWEKAIAEELNALNRNGTWTLVEKPKNAKLIGNKWVFRLKRNQNGDIVRHKARLVAKGFMQREGFDYEETYAPVAKLTTVRTLISIVNQKNLHAQQMDVKSAFLHGKVKEDIFMSVPEGLEAEDNVVCKLNKALYGRKQAPFCWNNWFNDFAEENNLIR
ncbi:Retrovirus-related Pol polyprotein from transposon TNT 1-94-like Protein [Tribolium castaneum]|uniref:Retrovirus-related Pol polyprotein from transposon TNT 1-94-like Protein n=1 Tax=Tribolium castaneum TaxID=7070 RepID=A0A139W9T1_TRICA|nr:Retrovirus-related Pol polyprotein from transposon TNT 1-94-like Protein [Tribolium castaneum]